MRVLELLEFNRWLSCMPVLEPLAARTARCERDHLQLIDWPGRNVRADVAIAWMWAGARVHAVRHRDDMVSDEV